jgi:aromatic ring-opening dioxygenase catalytic subunit (LigB family)
MPDTVYIDRAVNWSKDLTRMKSRGPGDIENAMRRIEQEYGIDYGFLWSLRYRRQQIRSISISVYQKISAAYQAECSRQMRKLKHEIAITEAITGIGNAVVDAAKAACSENTDPTD